MAANDSSVIEITTATVRATAVTHRMMLGWTPTTHEVTEFCKFESEQGAYAMLVRMSDVVPIYWDKADGRWHMLQAGETRKRCHYVITD